MQKLNSPVVWTAIVTPFFENGEIDFASFEGLLKAQEEAGNGIVILGSTGEAMALEEAERLELVKFTLARRLKSPIMVGVPGNQQKATLRWVESCRDLGVDAFLAVTPYYAKPGLQGQVEWFRAILATAQKPVMIYNVPSRTGVKLNPRVLDLLKNEANLWAVKESSGSVTDFQDLVSANPKLRFYCGDDGLMPFFATAGAVGLVSVAANVWPKATKLFTERSLARKTETLFPLWREATDTLFFASNPIPTKALLFALGKTKSAVTRAPLSAKDLPDLKPLQVADVRINSWLKEAATL